jgi:hypothetical protein
VEDPLGVRAAAARVVAQARYVVIDDQALQAACTGFGAQLSVPEWNDEYHFGDGTERTANYILLLDGLNFSFWGEPRWGIDYRGQTLDGYWALAAALKRAIEDGADVTDARLLAELDEAALAHILRGQGVIPMLRERCAHAREIGRVLRDQFGGQCAQLVEGCGYSASGVAQSVVEHFGSFHDAPSYHGQTVPIYKRAQIVAADLYGAFGGQGWGALEGIESLTCFADYKLPQILRRWGVLRYAESLAERVDARIEIPAGSDEEIEIRAATIDAVERMRVALSQRGVNMTSMQIDWALWEAAQDRPPDGKPYHRTRTIYY